MKIKVGVFFGGKSVEHEISIITAVQAMEYLDKDKYEVIPVYISKDKHMYTADKLLCMETYKDLENIKNICDEVTLGKVNNEFILRKVKGLFNKNITSLDIAFPIVHGKGVEDGTLSGFFDTIGIPYVGSDVMGASLGQDKVIQKQVMQSEGIPVVDYVWFYENEYLTNKEEIEKKVDKLGYPVIVKPARLGSSIGIKVVKEKESLEDAILTAISYDEKIIVEKMVPNLLEVDCAVVGNYDDMETSLIGEMLTENDLLTFEDKYMSDGSKSKTSKSSSGFRIPAKLDKKIENDIYDYSKKAFRALNLKGVTRFDFLVDKETKQVYVNEPNTIPGCLAFFFFTKKGISYPELLDRCINIAIKDYKNNESKISSFTSNVLSTYKGGSKGTKNNF